MSWRDIVRKAHCMAKMGEPCDCSECLNKGAKPDFLDLDGDGNKTESMKDAARQKRNEVSKKMNVRRKEPKVDRCPKCRKPLAAFMGSNTGLCENPSCSEYNPNKLRGYGKETYPRPKNPFTRKD